MLSCFFYFDRFHFHCRSDIIHTGHLLFVQDIQTPNEPCQSNESSQQGNNLSKLSTSWLIIIDVWGNIFLLLKPNQPLGLWGEQTIPGSPPCFGRPFFFLKDRDRASIGSRPKCLHCNTFGCNNAIQVGRTNGPEVEICPNKNPTKEENTRWWFQRVFYVHPENWGRWTQFWRAYFSNWVETTNQKILPSGKLHMAGWKNGPWINMAIFHCHVSLLEGIGNAFFGAMKS